MGENIEQSYLPMGVRSIGSRGGPPVCTFDLVASHLHCRTRRIRATAEQINQLITIVEDRNLHTDQFAGVEGKQKLKSEWNLVATVLNQLGPTKSGPDWANTWRELKNRVKKTVRASSQASNNVIRTPKMSDQDRRVLTLVGPYPTIKVRGPSLGFQMDADTCKSSSPNFESEDDSNFMTYLLSRTEEPEKRGEKRTHQEARRRPSSTLSDLESDDDCSPSTRRRVIDASRSNSTEKGICQEDHKPLDFVSGDDSNLITDPLSANEETFRSKSRERRTHNEPSNIDAAVEAIIRQGEIIAAAIVKGAEIIANAISNVPR